jgi:hypothetical protein
MTLTVMSGTNQPSEFLTFSLLRAGKDRLTFGAPVATRTAVETIPGHYPICVIP